MPALAKAVKQLPLRSGWLDGEVLMLDAQGIPDFQALQNAFDGSPTGNLVYYVFDMPYADDATCGSCPSWSGGSCCGRWWKSRPRTAYASAKRSRRSRPIWCPRLASWASRA